jgi:hypothetical protein
LRYRSRFFCAILSQGHDISGDVGELVVGKQRVRPKIDSLKLW